MKLMIDIPDETYNKMRRGEKLYPADANVAIFAIETGTPLSESEDCVSRQDAINIVVCDILSSAIVYGRTEEGMAAKKAIVDGLKRLPSATPAEKVGQWIPVSEGGYPEAYTEVLVYDSSDYFIAWWTGIRGRWDSYNSQFDINTPIVAWMPIKPYKASPTGEEVE